jgi:Protein of unknown function (DUF2975)
MEPPPDTVDRPETRRRLTEPLAGVLWLMLALVVATLTVSLIATATSRSTVWFGFGSGGTCASAPLNGLRLDVDGNSQVNFGPGRDATADSLQLCVSHPTPEQRILVTLTQAPTYCLYLAVLVLLWLLVLTVRRHGPFALGVSRRLRVLGWLILAGTLATGAGQNAARAYYAGTVVGHPVSVATYVINDVLTSLIPVLLIVCGLLTLARIIRIGAQMHEDLAGTV